MLVARLCLPAIVLPFLFPDSGVRLLFFVWLTTLPSLLVRRWFVVTLLAVFSVNPRMPEVFELVVLGACWFPGVRFADFATPLPKTGTV